MYISYFIGENWIYKNEKLKMIFFLHEKNLSLFELHKLMRTFNK